MSGIPWYSAPRVTIASQINSSAVSMVNFSKDMFLLTIIAFGYLKPRNDVALRHGWYKRWC